MPPPYPIVDRIKNVRKKLRKNLRGLGAGVGEDEDGGGGGGGGRELDAEGEGGVSGVIGDESVEPPGAVPVAAASFTFDAFMDVATRPGGRGSEVAELRDPGSTMGLESPILGFC